MLFEINVKMNDEDYLKFNEFVAIRSHYGRPQIRSLRIFITALLVLLAVLKIIANGICEDTIFSLVAIAISALIANLFMNKLMAFFLKLQIKSMKKKGRMGYSPESVLQFYDDVLVETTPTEKNERSYSTLERVSIVGDETVYIHFNNIMACILPRASFESDEQYNAFLEFIKTKCDNIDVY